MDIRYEVTGPDTDIVNLTFEGITIPTHHTTDRSGGLTCPVIGVHAQIRQGVESTVKIAGTIHQQQLGLVFGSVGGH